MSPRPALLLAALCAALLLAPAAAQSTPEQEVAALLAFKKGLTKSDGLVGWKEGVSSACSGWAGLVCSSTGAVTGL